MKTSLLLLLMSYFGLAAVIAAEPFAITNDENLQISWHGKPLVLGERFSWLGEPGFAAAAKRMEKVGNHTVYNRFGELKELTYRREAALKDGGREVEISFQFNIPAYSPGADDKPKAYELSFNYKDFANWKYSAVIDRVSRAKTITGVLPADPPDGNVIKHRIRQIILTSPDGKKSLVIDCSPGGVNDFYSDYPPNGIMSLWGFQKAGDKLKVILGYTPRFFGGSNTGKVQLYEGTPQNTYRQRHAQNNYRYFSELPSDRQYVFGAKKFGEMYTSINGQKYNDKLQAGWVNPKNLTVTNYRASGALYSNTASSERNIFRMSGLRRGLHIITLGIPTFDKAAGPMKITAEGFTIAENLKLPAKNVTMVTAPIWIEDGSVDIEFSGNWQVATINDQLLMSSAEDFTCRRGFWVSTQGPHPAVLFQSPHYAALPNYNVGIASYPLPEPGQEAAKPRKELTYPTGYAEFADGTDWRRSVDLSSWGTSNNGTFSEFAAPGKVEKRIGQILDDKGNAVIVNGMLSRHTYPAHTQRIAKMFRKITDTGHKHNIKFMDHWDFSLLWNCDSGFRVMSQRMDQLQHTVNCGLPARGLCPINPKTRKVFFKSVLDHIKATNLDGLMVDEVAFMGTNFCGCAYCRKKFTADTNWEVPADETSKVWQDRNSPLRRAWHAWRIKAIGDFWVDLRNEVRKVKKDFVFIGYTTHYGMYSTFASMTLGFSMEAYCRAWDMVGTEIMSRNVFASYRSIACFRKMKNMYYNVYNIPTFGLVYSSSRNWDVYYFGWALNNLNAQATWAITGVQCPPDKPNFRQFDIAAGNPDKRLVKSRAEIAVLFSNHSRDCERFATGNADGMGLSQVMNANHIPHEFIFDAGLTPEILKQYKVLICANNTALTENNVKAIRKFAEAGGKVLLTNFSGYFDDLAQKRKHWIVGQELLNKSDYSRRNAQSRFMALSNKASGKVIKMPYKASYMSFNLSPELETLWELVLVNGRKVPGLVRNKLGKGEVFYTPVAFGTHSTAYEVTSTKPMKFQLNPAAEAIALDLLKIVAGKHFAWETFDVPSQVITSLYQHQDGRVIAHFLNATKSNYKKGEIVPHDPPKNAFEPLQKAMSFKVKHPGKKAYAVSPEWKSKRELSLKRDGEYAIVTIPAGTLSCYMIVYVE